MKISTTIFDPHGIVDDTTSEDMVLRENITLVPPTSGRRYVVMVTMHNVDSGKNWYVVEYFDTHSEAEDSYIHAAEQAEIDAEEDPDDMSDYYSSVVLISL